MTSLLSSADLALAQRLEQGHVASGLAFVQAYQQQYPDSQASTEAVAGGQAMFQGVGLPSTQALGIGMNGPVLAEELDRLEAFFFQRGSPAVLDLCTLAHQSIWALVQERGYTVREVSNVLAKRLVADEPFAAPSPFQISAVLPENIYDWGGMVMRAFLETEQVPEDYLATMSIVLPDQYAYVCSEQGEGLGGAAMNIQERLATFYGDATLLRSRRRGVQLGLIYHRLRAAVELGCDLASASVWPGTASHRNYERAGFQLVYTRIMVNRQSEKISLS